MRKAPFIILTLVVVFLSVVVGVLVHRARVPRALTTEPAASNADYRLKQVHLQEQGRDGSRWQLDAEYSETFEEQNKTTMKKVTVKVDQPSKGDQASRSWTVTGDEGDLNQETKNVELRGNVPTRLSKVETGRVHAAILAAAGLIRLEVERRITMFFEPPDWLPAPGQGAIAIQVNSDDSALRELFAALDHPPTSIATRAERAFLAALDGGCQVPIGALVGETDGRPTLYGMLADVTGRHIVRGSRVLDPDSPESTGNALAAEIRARGGSSLLVELRQLSKLPAPQPE
jgi:lipopolysaccharide export system protein LptC